MPTQANAAASGFIPQIWANRALILFRKKIVIASRIRRDTDFGGFTVGDTLTIPYFGTLTAQDKAANSPATTQEPAGGSKVTVTLDKFKYIDILVPDIVKAQANTALMDSYLDPMVEGLATAVEGDLFALYTSFSTTIGTAGTDLTKAVVSLARQKMNEKNVPKTERTLVMAAKDETALLNDSTLSNYFANQRAEAIAEGSIGRLDGFDMFQSNLVPSTGSAPVSTKNIAFHRDAMILATRALEAPPEGTGVKSASVTDTESGLTMRALSEYSMADRGLKVGLDMLYGVKLLRDASGVIVLS